MGSTLMYKQYDVLNVMSDIYMGMWENVLFGSEQLYAI
jgi:hypothetical protein